ncbi:MAG: CZB domain-containing protein [Gammaproteobacteria bacterium]|nr:CZB domain-containing protein [Gammaproteobacteria bacterium]
MNIDEVINEHYQWKVLVEGLFDQKTSNLVDSSLISTDINCSLGKWIISNEAEQISQTQMFKDLKKIHKNFHQLAGTILVDFQSGRVEQANHLLSEYQESSQEIIKILEQLRNFI